MTTTRQTRRLRQYQVLTALVTFGQPASREMLANLTGLHQSKINGRVRELLDKGWLMEHGTLITSSNCKAKALRATMIGRAAVEVKK